MPISPSSAPAFGHEAVVRRFLAAGAASRSSAGDSFAGSFAQPARDQPRHPPDGVVVEDQVADDRRGRQSLRFGLPQDRQPGPADQQHDHHRRHVHDLQRIVGRLVDALGVAPPEVDRDERGDAGGVEIDRSRRGVPRMAEVGRGLRHQADDVLPGRDAGDRAGQDVVEHQRGDRQLRQRPAHRLLDDAIDAAAREHRARLDVDGADGVREQHHAEHEPRARRVPTACSAMPPT